MTLLCRHPCVSVQNMANKPRELTHSATSKRVMTFATAVALVSVSLYAAPAAERIHLAPRFVAGQILRYQIETHTSTTGKATTPIVDPEAATKFAQTATLIVRLDVLDVKPNPDGSTARVRLRATYEKSDAIIESDAYDPSAAALQEQYEKLQGRAFQFTIEPDGKVTDLSGIDDILANPSTSGAVQSWMEGVASAAKFPKEGIAIAQKWTGDRPLHSTPLAGLTFRTESTYTRDESCPTTAARTDDVVSDGAATMPAVPSDPTAAVCALILTKFRIFRPGGDDSDATPEGYLHNGLRTAGTWTGSGESLDDISLANGMLVRSTQTGHQDMDFEIASAASGSKMKYAGHVDSQSEIVLLPNERQP
jgi:hypothetical protein